MQIHMINVEKYGFWLSEFATVMILRLFALIVQSNRIPDYGSDDEGLNPSWGTKKGTVLVPLFF